MSTGKRALVSFRIILPALLLCSGCDLRNSSAPPILLKQATAPSPPALSPAANASSSASEPHIQRPEASAVQLPFTGRLIQGDRDELPPAVAHALSPDGPVTFAYREQISHDDYHIPMAVTALDPVTYFGAPLGDLGVTAFATLTIQRGDTVIGDYTAKAHVSKSYTLYSKPTHREVEQAARDAVREKIDAKLAHDSARLARASAAQNNLPAPQLPE